MIRQVLRRMNRREQVLAGLVLLVVFVLANLFLWGWLLHAIGDSRVEVAKRKVRGRRWFIFSTTCKHLMLSLFLRAQILPSIRVI